MARKPRQPARAEYTLAQCRITSYNVCYTKLLRLAGCLGFLAIRYIPGAAGKKWVLAFPPAILALNILEAVIRDFQVAGINGFHDGMLLVGGPWNVMNGVAGILNIVTISGS